MQKTVEDVKKEFNDKISVLGNALCFIYVFINYITFLVDIIIIKSLIKTVSISIHIALSIYTALLLTLLIYDIVYKWKKKLMSYIATFISILIISYELYVSGDSDIFLYLLSCIAMSFAFFDKMYVLIIGGTITIAIVVVAVMKYIILYDVPFVDFIWNNYYPMLISVFFTAFFYIACKYIKNIMLNEQIGEYMIKKSMKDNALASKIQEGFLNNEFPSNEVYDIDACMIPSKDVGGDFYDFYVMDKSRIVMIVADVSGKGIPAALLMANAKTVIKNSIVNGISFEKSMETANREIIKENKEMQFITIFICIVDLLTGKMNYINAGHVKPLVINKDGKVTTIVSKPDFIFGVRKDTRYHSNEYILNPGDRLFLCTDGVTERLNVNGELYGKGRLEKTLSVNSEKTAQEVIPSILKSLEEYANGKEQNDDITCLLFNYKKHLILEPPIERDFDVSKEKVTDIIAYIKETLKLKDVPDRIINLMVVASDEIISNVSKYAYEGLDKEKKLNINIQVYNRTINIIYTDYGKYFNPLSKITTSGTTKVTEKSKIGGLGIQLTWNIMDQVIYNRIDDRNMILIEKEY